MKSYVTLDILNVLHETESCHHHEFHSCSTHTVRAPFIKDPIIILVTIFMTVVSLDSGCISNVHFPLVLTASYVIKIFLRIKFWV